MQNINHEQLVYYLSKQKILVVLGGLAGVGKSSLAQQLCSKLPNSLHLDETVVTKALLADKPYFSPYYELYVKKQSYDCLAQLSLSNLSNDKIIIIDGDWTNKLVSPDYSNLLNSEEFTTVYLHLDCDPKEQFNRLKQRQAAQDYAKCKDWGSFLIYRQEAINANQAAYDKLQRGMPTLKLDTTTGVTKFMPRILQFLYDTSKQQNNTEKFIQDSVNNVFGSSQKIVELLDKIRL